MNRDDHKNGSVSFTIDGQDYETTDRSQLASQLLELAKLDPARYDLGELHGQRPEPRRYRDDQSVTVHPGARFVSIRQAAPVA